MKFFGGVICLMIAGIFLYSGFAFILGDREPETLRELGLFYLRLLLIGTCLLGGAAIMHTARERDQRAMPVAERIRRQ